jgi:hypothetical protein
MYRLFPLEHQELEKQVTKEGRNTQGIPKSLRCSCLVCAEAYGRGLRLSVDYQALNSIIVKSRCTIPRIDNLLDAVAGFEYFTSLDFTSGYH